MPLTITASVVPEALVPCTVREHSPSPKPSGPSLPSGESPSANTPHNGLPDPAACPTVPLALDPQAAGNAAWNRSALQTARLHLLRNPQKRGIKHTPPSWGTRRTRQPRPPWPWEGRGWGLGGEQGRRNPSKAAALTQGVTLYPPWTSSGNRVDCPSGVLGGAPNAAPTGKGPAQVSTALGWGSPRWASPAQMSHLQIWAGSWPTTDRLPPSSKSLSLSQPRGLAWQRAKHRCPRRWRPRGRAGPGCSPPDAVCTSSEDPVKCGSSVPLLLPREGLFRGPAPASAAGAHGADMTGCSA